MGNQSKMKKDQSDSLVSKALHLTFTYFRYFGSCMLIYGLGYFNFSISWIMFGTFGYLAYKRSIEKRIIVNEALKAIGKNEKKCILESLTTRELPSWVFFPDVERAEWLNKIIKRTWPFISDYVEKMLIDTVQPMVNSYIPEKMGEFKFTTIDLGDMPPRIGGVKVYTEDSIARDEIVMDIDLMLYSDGRIKVQVGTIMAGVKEFELRGTLRVVLKPLVPKIPFAGAFTVYFLDDPKINFFLTHVGNILTMPGLLQTLTETIKSVVNQMVVVPNRICVNLVDEVDISKLKYPWPQGVVVVNVISGKNLKAGDISFVGKKYSDPFCEIISRSAKFKTKIIQKTLDPTWNEFFEIIIEEHTTEKIKINVYDKDQGNKDDFLGTVDISLEPVFHKGKFQKVYYLQQVKTGCLKIRFFWLNFNSDRDIFKKLKYESDPLLRDHYGKEISLGFLMITVDSAKNLGQSSEEPSPYVSVSLNRESKKTDPKEKTRDPVWEHTMYFLVKDPYHDTVELTVRDMKTSKKLGDLTFPISSLLAMPDMKMNQPFKLKDGQNSAINLVLQLQGLESGVGHDEHDHTFDVHDDEGDEIDINKPDSPLKHDHGHDHGDHDDHEDQVVDYDDDQTDDHAGENQHVSAIQSTAALDLKDPDQEVRIRNVPKDLVSNDKRKNKDDLKSHDSFMIREPSDSCGKIEVSAKYTAGSNNLDVTIFQCSGLNGVESDGLSDPYIKLYLFDKEQGNMVNYKQRTKVIKNSLNPIFNESFQFPVDSDDLGKLEIHFDVKNKGSRFGKNDPLGYLVLPLTSYDMETGNRVWHWLSMREPQQSEKSSVFGLVKKHRNSSKKH